MVDWIEHPATWRLLDLSYDSAFRNLALEEALTKTHLEKNSVTPTIRVWVNHPTVVIGRFQDVKSEVDVKFCARDGIPIVRRFTGGGAVYHDDGNLNLTVSMPPPKKIELQGFQRAMSTIIQDWLGSLGLDAEYVQPNSIEVSGKKICGAAIGLGRDFILWHSSILISTDIGVLTRTLSPSRWPIETPYVRSKWRPVASLEQLLKEHIPMNEAKNSLLRSVLKITESKLQHRPLSIMELKDVRALMVEKYSRSEWNYLGDPSASQRR